MSIDELHKIWYNRVTQMPKGGYTMWAEMSYNKCELTFSEKLEIEPEFEESVFSYYFSEVVFVADYLKRLTRGDAIGDD